MRPNKAYLNGRYLWLPGEAAARASVSSGALPELSGDLDLRAKAVARNSSSAALISKFSSGSGGFELAVNASGNVELHWVELTTNKSETSTAAASGGIEWVRATIDVDNGASGYDVKFYTSDDGSTWTQLGTTITGGSTTSIGTSLVEVRVGGRPDDTKAFHGRIYRAQIYNDLTETDLELDADFSAVDRGSSSFTESSTNAATVSIDN